MFRALLYESVGREFESLRAHHSIQSQSARSAFARETPPPSNEIFLCHRCKASVNRAHRASSQAIHDQRHAVSFHW
jgi:hypothetical protein